MVERARDRFVEEHQPGVFERAAVQIEKATHGSWASVRMPDGEKAGARSEIIGRDGSRTPFAELSEGTVGLVYLCLRAGLVDEMHDDGGPELPVLMDDVLTHLDPVRRAGAAAVIADLATRHQVLYFTCHPEQVQATIDASIDRKMFEDDYADVFAGDERWRELDPCWARCFYRQVGMDPEAMYGAFACARRKSAA